MEIKIGHIELVNNPIESANDYFAMQNPQNTRLFCANELDIETARSIIDESYIASEEIKQILIAALSYNTYAQNALLKVLEEPPSGTIFIIYAKMKSLLLPTIRSRLPIINHIKQQRLPHFPLSLKTLNLEGVYRFLKEREKEFNNPFLKEEIQSLYLDSIKYGLSFSAREAQIFEKALFWENQYESTSNIFAVLLLLVLRKKKQQFNVTLKG
ncbi:DNA polymerase III subunit delta' [Helicobacter turcicus]|uniref:DNA polymerase III subunit delta n=1 Tax=Helicobacter turcicus TaxID=2867412 RepID=A0ABS7JNJ9_9HELI|nr:DNA polymerase III subunit delta' [Helicobacter turcicus]MBX7490952.1 DNA polymerase III subunit delta [Helicobacter turcicus]MBX7545806.1 DNA polymerase III subunit delta [Helicobacter turcicus]